MKKTLLGQTNLELSAIILGCMRIHGAQNPNALIKTAFENGIDYFDHADIYGKGECETLFGQVVRTEKIPRDKMFIQSKAGIVPGKMYDLSKEYLIQSVEDILTRLQMDYLDAFLLHRPDALIEPEEVAEAFTLLEKQGKVRYFGVSNHNSAQLTLLEKQLTQPLIINQLQFGLAHTGLIDQGLNVNMKSAASIDHDGSTLDFCRLKDISIQAWSPFQSDAGVFIGNPAFPELNDKIDELAAKYQTTAIGIATAWVLRHPAKMQMVAGTTQVSRLEQIMTASEIVLSKEDWYGLYLAAGNLLP